MKNISGGLLAFLQANTTCYRADLFTMTLISGQVIRATSGQLDITFGGNNYAAGSSGGFKRGKIKTSTGLQVDTMDLEIVADTNITIPTLGVNYMTAASLGLLDGALVRVETLYMGTYGDVSNGSEVKFVGEITNVDEVGRSIVKCTVASLVYRLNNMLPKHLVQAPCRWTLYDGGCTLNKSSFGVNDTVQSGSTTMVINFTNPGGKPDGYYALGTITFTGGQNTGLTATIKTHVGTVLTLNVPMILPVATSDAFTVYPGCDKLQATCSGKFSNLINFGGFPYTPVPETAI